MAQQTAVEWLLEKMKNLNVVNAKGAEWDDGDYAYFYSKETGRDFENGEQYYNETYNK